MTRDEFNRLCADLPATSHVVQWGGSDVWKVGDKVFAIGGEIEGRLTVTFKASDIAFEVLGAAPGLRPAPYMASRGLKWIQDYAEPGLSDPDLAEHIRLSWRLVAQGLSRKKRAAFGIDLSAQAGDQT
ncbi:MAG: MmcQ/YjbR family DNA-binding protein [Pseudomonadota bacterium]